MNRYLPILIILGLASAFAQPKNEEPRSNHGKIPAPPPRREANARPEVERKPGGRINNAPHVSEDRWYGHDKPGDKRYQRAGPSAAGRFERFGPSYRYNIVRFDANLHRFWLPGGFFFEVAAWDWPFAANWCWTCAGDDFVVYEDNDHLGWYLLYNVHTGLYVHARYLGL